MSSHERRAQSEFSLKNTRDIHDITESKLRTRRKYRVKSNRKKNEATDQKYDIDITNEITNTNLLNSLYELSLNIYRDITYLVHSSVDSEN